MTRLEVPPEGVAAFADPGANIEHADFKQIDPQGRPLQLQLLESGNYAGEKGLVRYVGVFAGTTYESQQYATAQSGKQPWDEAYGKLKP